MDASTSNLERLNCKVWLISILKMQKILIGAALDSTFQGSGLSAALVKREPFGRRHGGEFGSHPIKVEEVFLPSHNDHDTVPASLVMQAATVR
jgi:hypothetical protein